MNVQIADYVRGQPAEVGAEVGAMHCWAGALVLQAARPLAATERASPVDFSIQPFQVRRPRGGYKRSS